MRKSLGAILAVGLAGLQFLAVIAVVTSSYVTSERALLRHANDLLRDVGQNTIEHSKGFLAPAQSAAELAARLAQNSVISSDDPVLLEQLLFQQLQISPNFAGIYYGSESGDFIMVMRDPNGPAPFRSKLVVHDEWGQRDVKHIWRNDQYTPIAQELLPQDHFDPRERPWYLSAKEQRATIWTDPYIFFSSQQPGITLAAPVLRDAQNIRGVVGVDIEITALSGFLSRLHIGKSGKALIIHRNGDVVAHPSPDRLKTKSDNGDLQLINIRDFDDPVARAALTASLGDGNGHIAQDHASDLTVDGVKYVTKIMPEISELLPWTIAIYAPETDFTGPIKQNRTINLWIAGAVALITAVIGLILANYIYKPVRAFAIRSSLVAQGALDPNEPMPKTYQELERVNDTLVREIAARRQTEHEYGQTLDLSHRPMAQVNATDGYLHRVNQSFIELTGYSGEELTQMRLSDLLLGQGVPLLHDNLRINQERLLVHKSGEIIDIWLSAIVIHDAGGKASHAVIVVDDLRSAKAKQRQIDQLNRDLSQIARGDMLGEMASGLAHELNQPLTAIAQHADIAKLLLSQEPLSKPDLDQALQEIETQSLRAGDIIRALRSFARKDEGLRSKFDLAELNAQVLHLVQVEARQNSVTIRSELPANLPHPVANRNQIALVLVNLARNAIEAMSESPQRELTISAWAQSDELFVKFADTGPGISQDLALFTQFETSKPQGMGLGLSLSRSIIEGHGGKLWQEQHPGLGAQFIFTLPLEAAL